MTAQVDWARCLEVLHHHLSYGAVWDGDQICKSDRYDLVEAGYLSRVDGSGYHALTRDGVQAALRTRKLYFGSRCIIRRLPISGDAMGWCYRQVGRIASRLIGPPPAKPRRHVP